MWFYGVMVSTLDFESSDPSSSLGRTFIFKLPEHCRQSFFVKRFHISAYVFQLVLLSFYYFSVTKMSAKIDLPLILTSVMLEFGLGNSLDALRRIYVKLCLTFCSSSLKADQTKEQARAINESTAKPSK